MTYQGRSNLYGCPGIYFDSHVPRSAILLFAHPVAFILGGLSMLFGFRYFFEVFQLIEFFNFVPRIWDGLRKPCSSCCPAFVYMGVMLERMA